MAENSSQYQDKVHHSLSGGGSIWYNKPSLLRSGDSVCRGGAGGAAMCEEEGQEQGWQGQPLHAQHHRGLLCYAGVIRQDSEFYNL